MFLLHEGIAELDAITNGWVRWLARSDAHLGFKRLIRQAFDAGMRAGARAALATPARPGCFHLADSDEPGSNLSDQPCTVCGRYFVDETLCDVLRGPESYQPSCTLPLGHDGPHSWSGRPRGT
jgi:hypothetical protein